MYNNISIIQLQYVTALARHQHFKKAAEACSVTQPTLSMQLQKLEEQIGLILFDRKSVPITPTPSGKPFIKQAEQVLFELDKLKQVVEDQKEAITGSFEIGALPTIGPYLFPRIIPGITKQFSQININAFEKTTEDLVQELQSGILDIGIMVTPYEAENLRFFPVYKEEFLLYISHRHKLFEKQEIDASELNPQEIWILQEGHCFREQVLNICGAKEGHAGNFSYRSGSLEALKRLVDKYGGITLLPELAVEDFDANSIKHLRRIKPPKPVREVSLAVHENFAKITLIKKLVSVIQNSLPFNLQDKNNFKLIRY
ncbi:MAG: LysR substrate-binding domain-containing protein [Candidatus Cyclobacteriaceae bacterium M2_1C_046]